MATPHGSPPLPRPKSPPELYGKRREFAKVVMLEREIGFLQEELKSIETLQPASCCIKEVADYVVANPEPLISTCKKTHFICYLLFENQHQVVVLLLVEIPASICHGFAAVATAAVRLKCQTAVPARCPTAVPARCPTAVPARYPTVVPARCPTVVPVHYPTVVPARYPTVVPAHCQSAVAVSGQAVQSV
ncbi:hypothetical protein L6452_21450 [Arctium lappa]|uniref:Uncharacterized protein n=1 Tax=Arctium lappa TaxID=4217 RepID=A0ACB9AXY4_ARCLA|nr:hypothetical protein L6452_21450 [Arctium lappa]